ncbi:MAG TPA: hypothetical protein VMF07_15510 [Solirubrobacteraceae bacterium]|nr:hypothetical protein [Solirubrobacteraceae bacterium]
MGSSVDGEVGYLTLADLGRRNVLSTELVGQAQQAHEELIAAGARAGVLRVDGPVFCAVGDPDLARVTGLARAEVAFIAEIHASRLFWVVAADGAVLGAGISLMLTRPYLVLTDRSSLAVPNSHPDGGHVGRRVPAGNAQGATFVGLNRMSCPCY